MADEGESNAQQRIAKLEHELRESRKCEQRLRAVFDNAFELIGLVSVDGILLEANRSALQFVGVTRDEVVGRPFVDTPWWSHAPELQQRLREAIAEAGRGGFVRFGATHVSADGAVHTVDF